MIGVDVVRVGMLDLICISLPEEIALVGGAWCTAEEIISNDQCILKRCVYQGDRRVYCQRWDRKIPRDFVWSGVLGGIIQRLKYGPER